MSTTTNTAYLERMIHKYEGFVEAIKEKVANEEYNLFHLCRFGDLDSMVMNEIKLVHLKAIVNGNAKLDAAIHVLKIKIKTMSAWSHSNLVELNALREVLILLEEFKEGKHS